MTRKKYRTFKPSMRDAYVREVLRMSRELNWTREDLIEFLLANYHVGELDGLCNIMHMLATFRNRNDPTN